MFKSCSNLSDSSASIMMKVNISPIHSRSCILGENKVTKVRAAIYHHHENVHMSTSHFLSLEKVTKLWGAWFRIPHLSRIFQKLVRPEIEMMNCEENNSSPGDPNPILIPEINNKNGSKCRSSFWIFIVDIRLWTRDWTGGTRAWSRCGAPPGPSSSWCLGWHPPCPQQGLWSHRGWATW